MLGSLRMSKSLAEDLTNILKKYVTVFGAAEEGIHDERIVYKFAQDILDANYAYFISERGSHFPKPTLSPQLDFRSPGAYSYASNTIIYKMGVFQNVPFDDLFYVNHSEQDSIYILAFLTEFMNMICHEFLHYTQNADFRYEEVWGKTATIEGRIEGWKRANLHNVYMHRKTELAAYALGDAITLAVFTAPKIYATEDRALMRKLLAAKGIYKSPVTRFDFSSPMELQDKLTKSYNDLLRGFPELNEAQRLELKKQYTVPRNPKQFEKYEKDIYGYYLKIFRRYVRDFSYMNQEMYPFMLKLSQESTQS